MSYDLSLSQIQELMSNSGGTDCCLYMTKAGFREGPAICDFDGFVLSSSVMNKLFCTILEEIYGEDPDTFSKAVSSIKDIREMINIFKTLRRYFNSHVMN